MSRMSRMSLVILAGTALALVGCGHSSTPETAAPSTAATAASAPVAVAASTTHTATALPGDHATTKRYRIDINYPHLTASEAPLARALQQTGAEAKREFMHGLPDPKQFPEFADRQLLLKLDFSVASRMPAFVSVRERGMSDMGGAHPLPVDASFVYATGPGKVIALGDLFSEPQAARERLARIARGKLKKTLLAQMPDEGETSAKVRKQWADNMRQMINDGTQPTRENFSGFVVLAGAGDKASGLQLIFSPYQVAPYVFGTQTVDVSVDAFADLLKPAYRDAFDVAS